MMKYLADVVLDYFEGRAERSETLELMAGLDMPLFKSDSEDGFYLVKGERKNSFAAVSEMMGDGVITPTQYDEALDMFIEAQPPKPRWEREQEMREAVEAFRRT